MRELSQTERDLLDKHLLGQLTGSEQETFAQLQQEPEFATIASMESELMSALKAHGRAQLKAELQALDQQAPASPPQEAKVRSLRSWTMYAAVAAAVLLLVVFFINRGGEQFDPQKVYADNFSPYQNIAVAVTRDVRQDTDTLQLAFSFYEQQAYEKAIPLLEACYETDPQPAYLFYIGNSQMALKQTEAAISNFEKVAATDAPPFSQAAQWYIALGKIQSNQLTEARVLMAQISQDSGHPFAQKATSLLETMPQAD